MTSDTVKAPAPSLMTFGLPTTRTAALGRGTPSVVTVCPFKEIVVATVTAAVAEAAPAELLAVSKYIVFAVTCATTDLLPVTSPTSGETASDVAPVDVQLRVTSPPP